MPSRTSSIMFLVLALVLAACSAGDAGSSASPMLPVEDSMTPSSTADLDEAFIDMMVPHHQAAIEMARIAQERATHDELRALADDIVSAQGSEIAQLRDWRKGWFGSGDTPGMDAMPLMPGMEMPAMSGMPMDGTMDMTADIEPLRTADPFDRAFIQAMTLHHESAIAAARIIAGSTDRPELQQIAAEIIEAQQREMDQMQGWLASWYPS